MVKSVYKYSLNSDDCPELLTVGRGETFAMEMVKGAEILCVREQSEINYLGNEVFTGRIWALVDSLETEKEKRYFRLIETGNIFNDDLLKYIGTFQVFAGQTILHLFEVINKKIVN